MSEMMTPLDHGTVVNRGELFCNGFEDTKISGRAEKLFQVKGVAIKDTLDIVHQVPIQTGHFTAKRFPGKSSGMVYHESLRGLHEFQ